jgi:hypothetical protein
MVATAMENENLSAAALTIEEKGAEPDSKPHAPAGLFDRSLEFARRLGKTH